MIVPISTSTNVVEDDVLVRIENSVFRNVKRRIIRGLKLEKSTFINRNSIWKTDKLPI